MPPFESGCGALLFDHDGKSIDFYHACSANLGHGNKEIAEAVKEQMDKITQYTFAYLTHYSILLRKTSKVGAR